MLLVLCVQVADAQTLPGNKQNINLFNQLNGVEFPTLELEDTSGKIISTASLKGKTIYVDFWFTACPPCVREIPFATSLQTYFSADTNIVFLNICIENVDRKNTWKQMIREKKMGGIHLFYARNRPQKVNLLRQYKVNNFPTYLLVNSNFKIVGYNAPAPSDKYWVQWAISQAANNVSLDDAYKQTFDKSFTNYIVANRSRIDSLQGLQ